VWHAALTREAPFAAVDMLSDACAGVVDAVAVLADTGTGDAAGRGDGHSRDIERSGFCRFAAPFMVLFTV